MLIWGPRGLALLLTMLLLWPMGASILCLGSLKVQSQLIRFSPKASSLFLPTHKPSHEMNKRARGLIASTIMST